MVPLIETPRMILRMIDVRDAAVFFELNSDPVVLRYTGDEPFSTVVEAEAFLAGYDQYRLYACGRLAMVRKEDGAVLGWCGLKYHADNGETDIGYRLFRKYWQQGYATEAAQAAVADGINRLGLSRFVAHLHPQNTASIRVAEKLGMHYHSTYEWEGQDWWKMERWISEAVTSGEEASI